jgi:hypothetical protein
MLLLLLILLPDFSISGAKKRRKKIIFQIFDQEYTILEVKKRTSDFYLTFLFKCSILQTL